MNLRTITALFLIAMVIPAYSDESKDTSSAFWSWFQTRESEFAKLFSYEIGAAAQDDRALQKKIQDTVGEVGTKLRSVHPEFSPFFGFSGGSNEMIITVHGQAKHFEAVDSLVDSAPSIKGWKFVALKKPLSLGVETEIQSGSAKLKVGDWRYTKTKNAEGTFDFVIFIPNKISDDPEGFDRLFTRLTIDFLGERFASSALGEVTVQQFTEDSPDELLPFVDIHKDVSAEKPKG